MLKLKEGEKYGMLTFIGVDRKPRYIFKCDCGKIVAKSKYSVAYGHTKSCGCYQKIGQYKK